MSGEAGGGQPPGTDRQRDIVAAARRILESEGPAAVTMRRVAAELGIRAPSLYKHVADKGVVEGLLQQHAMAEFGAAMRAAGRAPHEVAAAYRAWALRNPHLYEIAVRRPLRRDVVGTTEQFAAEPLIEAFGGDPDRAMAFLGLAHGLVDLELSGHFPSGTDIDAIWRVAVACLATGPTPARRSPGTPRGATAVTRRTPAQTPAAHASRKSAP
jgi:AcrR family transcriptional regulator